MSSLNQQRSPPELTTICNTKEIHRNYDETQKSNNKISNKDSKCYYL